MAKKYLKFSETHRTLGGVKLKRCTKCKKWKEENEFRKDRARKDGLRLYCKGCDAAYLRERRRREGKTVRKYLRCEERHRIVRGVKEKLCSGCKQWKFESCFNKNRLLKDGLACRCKDCRSKRYERTRTTVRKNLRFEDRHRVVNGVKDKLCRKCSKWKAESEFYNNKSARDGLSEWCKKCSYTAAKKYQKLRPAVKN